MNKLLIGLLTLFSISAFADDLVGLNCSTNYVLHEVSRTPYDINRVVIRKSLLGGRSVLGYAPINNYVNDFREGLNLADDNEAITYSLYIQEETSVLSIKVKTNGNEVTLLNDYQFKTKEGFADRISLSHLIHFGTLHATHLVLTCLPAYR